MHCVEWRGKVITPISKTVEQYKTNNFLEEQMLDIDVQMNVNTS